MKQEKIKNFFNNGAIETSNFGLKNKASLERWKLAQNSEKEYWQDYTTDSLLKESGDRYSKKAKILLEDWSKFIKINKSTKILQIGSGPEDIINYLTIGKKYSIDPLSEFYKKKFNLDYKSTHLTEGTGEKIPFSDKFFDIVILINVLDHTHLPDKVLFEVNRVLKNKGIFHFENYIYQKRFIQIARLWGRFRKLLSGEIFNIHHPYMFTATDLRRLVLKNFKILHEEIGRDIGIYENLEEYKKKKKKEKKLRRKIPMKLGLIGRINYTCICKKTIFKKDFIKIM